MGIIKRGFRNAFRNSIRTLSVVVILAISIGLALIMLLSYQTVKNKITSVVASIGNTVTVTPAGADGFQGGGEPLTESQMKDIRSLAHISSVVETLSDRLAPSTDTSLASAIDPGTLGDRQGRFNQQGSSAGNQKNQNQTRTFTVPIIATGISDTALLTSGTSSLNSGEVFDGTRDDAVAIIGKDLAAKNNLSAGSTFTAYGNTITVKGIYDASGNRFANSGFYMPIRSLQKISGLTDQVTQASVRVDAITNIDSAVTDIKNKLGADKADVISNADQAKQSLTPLENIKNISFYSLIGALVAGAIITLLTMVMIVRERRREIGVLKAIGASNTGVVGQFVVESLVLTLLGSIVGMVLGLLFGNPVLNALVASNISTGGGRGFGRIAGLGAQLGGGVQNTIRDLHTSAGFTIILYGLVAAIGIAIIGSAVPAWLIAKVRPAEVLRSE